MYVKYIKRNRALNFQFSLFALSDLYCKYILIYMIMLIMLNQ